MQSGSGNIHYGISGLPLELVAAAGAMVLIAASILIVRYGHVRFPYNE